MRIVLPAMTVLLTLSLLPSGLHAKMGAEELARLDSERTPMGAVRAGTEDGLIPEYSGTIKGLPEGVAWEGPGTPYPNPWPDEKPLFTITIDNLDQYRDRLTPGQIALFETYSETFRMPVYPGHREFAFSDAHLAKARYNAEHAELLNEGNGVRGYIGGPAFPVPSTGNEAVWLGRTSGGYSTLAGEYADIAVFPNGTKSVRRQNFWEELAYNAPMNVETELVEANEYPNRGEWASRSLIITTEPARDKGLITSVSEPYDHADFAREVWRYLPGSRRVRRAPTVGYDTPDGPGGLKTIDEVRGFNGALDRFEWKLLGVREVFVPYHNYDLDDPSLPYDKVLTKFHVNPDYMRYELKRVWVAEGTLREGQRHVYGKRRIYVDQDTAQIPITENFDGRGELWKVVMFANIYEYGNQTYVRRMNMYHDLRAGAYIAERLINDTKPMLYSQKESRGDSYFQPANIRKLGRR